MASSSRSSTGRGGTSTRRSARRTSCCRRISTASRHSFPADWRATLLFGRGSCDAKGVAASQVAAVETLRQRGHHERRSAVCGRRGARQRRREDRAEAGFGIEVSHQRRADRQPARHRHSRRAAVNLRAKGRAAHSSFPELGESAIEKLLDALIMLRRIELPEDPVHGPDALHGGRDQRGRCAERHSAGSRGGSHVPHGWRRARPAGDR